MAQPGQTGRQKRLSLRSSTLYSVHFFSDLDEACSHWRGIYLPKSTFLLPRLGSRVSVPFLPEGDPSLQDHHCQKGRYRAWQEGSSTTSILLLFGNPQACRLPWGSSCLLLVTQPVLRSRWINCMQHSSGGT